MAPFSFADLIPVKIDTSGGTTVDLVVGVAGKRAWVVNFVLTGTGTAKFTSTIGTDVTDLTGAMALPITGAYSPVGHVGAASGGTASLVVSAATKGYVNVVLI